MPAGPVAPADSPETPSSLRFAFRGVLTAGVLLRVLVLVFQGPDNNDVHSQVIDEILAHHALPLSNARFSSYHPPLYYLLAAPWSLIGGKAGAHLFSALLSILNLGVLYVLIKRRLGAGAAIQLICLALAAFLPPFVMFSGYISNDALAFLFGSLVFMQTLASLDRASDRNVALLGLLVGLGLSTKFTFLPYAPVVLGALAVAQAHQRLPRRQRIFQLAIFCVLVVGLGSYKFVENAIHFGRPFLSNVDTFPGWARLQRGSYVGARSIFDINILRLVLHPTIGAETPHSYPLLLYGTFWAEHIPESNFRSGIGMGYVGPAIYLLATVPSLLMALGCGRASKLAARLFRFRTMSPDEYRRSTVAALSILLVAANLALVVYAFVKTDAWSIFQARLLFPAMFAFLVFLGLGLETIWSRPRLQFLAGAVLGVLCAAFVAYFGIEIGSQLLA